jgi:predicted transposase YbfD/YdcC
MQSTQSEGAQSSRVPDDETDYLADADLSDLLGAFRKVEDLRGRNGLQYAQSFILGVCAVAVLAGAKRYSEIARKARGMSQRLLARLGAEWNWFRRRYPRPSMATIRRVLCLIDAAMLDRILGEWLAAHAPEGDDGDLWVAVDGKVLRGSWTDENGQVTLFSAMIQREGITIAQVRVPDGTNEITQVPELLEAVPIPAHMPAVFTLDAAHTNADTAREIRKRPGWHYVMEVKGNQSKLQRAVFDKVLPFFREAPHDIMEEDSRGVLKRWSCWITDADGIDFPEIRQVGAIRRDVFNRSGDRLSKEIALVLTSKEAGELTAVGLNRGKRDHWGIENKEHYVRDTVYQEDLGQEWSGEGPQSLSGIRNLAMSQIRLKGFNNIKEITEWVAEDRDRAVYFMCA